MNDQRMQGRPAKKRANSTESLLMRLDLAVETLENLDELGVDNRVELQALLQKLERQIEDLDAGSPGETRA
jgi:hypothetical protein